MIQGTSFGVISLYRGPLPILPVPWETIQLDNIAFPAQRYFFSVILDHILQPGHSVHLSVCFHTHFCKKSKFVW